MANNIESIVVDGVGVIIYAAGWAMAIVLTPLWLPFYGLGLLARKKGWNV